jgi:hypothetical protein
MLSTIKRVSRKRATEIIQALCEHSTRFKNAYFFRPPQSASGRRWYEKSNSIKKQFYWVHEHKRYEVSIDFTVSVSCRNVYINRVYTLNKKPCNLLKLKNLIK